MPCAQYNFPSGKTLRVILTMTVDPPLRPRVPVAACWQQSSRGAKNPPDVWLPPPQVHAEEATKKTTRSSVSNHISVSSQKSTKSPMMTISSKQNMTNCRSTTNMNLGSKQATVEQASKLNIGTWNVRTLRTEGNWDILLEEARRFEIDILGLCETHLTDTETLINKDEYTILLSSRKDGVSREGVGLMITQPILQCLQSFEAISPRLLTAKFKMKEGIVNLIQAYAPTTSHSESVSDEFYDDLQLLIQKIPKKETLIILGDFNAKLGTDHDTWAPTLGKFGLGSINERGEKLLEFCTLHKLVVCNTQFQHKKCRRVTWTSPCGQYKNLIDFIMTHQDNLNIFQNCRAYCSADIGSDHNLVLAKVKLVPTKAKRMKSMPKAYDVSRFNNPTIAEEFRTRIGGAFEPLLQLEDTDVEGLWCKFRDATNKATEETAGLKRPRQVRGLPEGVRKACQQRRKARILMMNKPTAQNKSAYSKLNKNVKYQVKQWKKKQLEAEVTEMELAHAKNNSHELFKKVRKLAGERNKLHTVAKNKDGVLKSAPSDVLKCWEDHFSKHLNTEFPRDPDVLDTIPEPPNVNTHSVPFTEEEAEEAIKSMKNNKACGWDKISAETLKAGGPVMRKLLLKIINAAWSSGDITEDWSRGLITPVFKKGDKLDPANYRAITLLSIPGKVFCKMVLNRIQNKIDDYLNEEQCGFRSARGTTDAVFVVRQILEKARERRVPIHWNFVDFKAAFDTIWRQALWKCLRSIGIDDTLVNLIESMYTQTKCAIMVNGKITEWFEVLVGVRQGCLLSPCLFNLFLEFVMKDVQNLGSGVQMGDMRINNIRYADDTTLMELVFEKLQLSTNEMEKACKRWGMKINPTKCKIMTNDPRDIILNNVPVDKVDDFVFLGSSVPSVEADVKRRTRLAAWAFSRLKATVWSNHDIRRSLKIRIYKALIRPIATYGAESWTLRKADHQKLQVFEMRCLRTILGVTIMDKIRNEDIRQKLDLDKTITEEVEQRRLKWFGHVLRMPQHRLPIMAYQNDFSVPRQPGRPPTRWRDQVCGDTGMPPPEAENQALERPEWRRITRSLARGHSVLCS